MTILALLNYSINSHASNYIGSPLRGSKLTDTTKVLVNIEYIKQANVKMIERNYLLEELVVKDSLIFSYKQLSDVQNKELNEYKENYKKIYDFNEYLVNKNIEVDKTMKNYKTATIVFGSISLAMTLTLVLFVFVK